MGKHGKRYRNDATGWDKDHAFDLADAIEKLKSFRPTKFDQTVDVVMHLGIDPRQADQMIRGSLSLPHGIGKNKRVIAFCAQDVIEDAKKAGAVEAGGEELVEKVAAGWMDFDVAVASPDMMRIVSKLGRVLGPKGLMPSPKSGTVTPNVPQAVSEYAAGKVEFRNDDGGNVHAPVGKLSFASDQLKDNTQAFIDHITKMKPSAVKSVFIKKIVVSATMTPGLTITQ